MNRREVHYHVRRLPTAVVVIASDPSTLEVCLVPHLVHHSPTGMEFGYAGSGPADLALSLLSFHLQAEPAYVKCLVKGEVSTELLRDNPALRVANLYQDFKVHALGGHGDDAIDLTGRQIDHWIEMMERRVAARTAASSGVYESS